MIGIPPFPALLPPAAKVGSPRSGYGAWVWDTQLLLRVPYTGVHE